MNFIALVVCAVDAIWQGVNGNFGLCLDNYSHNPTRSLASWQLTRNCIGIDKFTINY